MIKLETPKNDDAQIRDVLDITHFLLESITSVSEHEIQKTEILIFVILPLCPQKKLDGRIVRTRVSFLN